jgi:hypothetical protein
VAKNGNDYLNNGSIDEPWKTPDYALANSQPGDTIFVRQGTYQSELWIKGGYGGARDSIKTITAFPGEEVIFEETVIRIYDDYVRIRGLILNQTDIRITSDHLEILNNHIILNSGSAAMSFRAGTCSYILIENNVIENDGLSSLRNGIFFNGGSYNVIRNNFIKGFTEVGIYIYDEYATTSEIIIEGNIISNSKFRSGIAVISHVRSNIDQIRITNNLLVDNAEFGIELRQRIENVMICQNTLIQASLDSIPYVWGNDRCGVFISEESDQVQIINNIFYNKDEFGTHIHKVGLDAALPDLSHNLYWPDSSRLLIVGSDWEDILGTFEDSHPIIGDPLFEDLSNDNYQLKDGSPAINCGLDIGLPFIGEKPDLGAFESSDTITTELRELPHYRISAPQLLQNYPNPFNPITMINYQLPVISDVELSIYNSLGQKVTTLVSGKQSAGYYQIEWNASGYSTGIYYYILHSGKFIDVKKMILLK